MYLCLSGLAVVEDDAVKHQIEEAVGDRDKGEEGLHRCAGQLAVEEAQHRADKKASLNDKLYRLFLGDYKSLSKRLDHQADAIERSLIDGIYARHAPVGAEEH